MSSLKLETINSTYNIILIIRHPWAKQLGDAIQSSPLPPKKNNLKNY